MRLDRTAHRAILALGTQVEVDDNAQLVCRRAKEVLYAVHNRRRAGSRLRLGGTPDGLVQGNHVGIRGVRALASAVAAHRNKHDGRPLLAPPLGFLPLRNSKGSENCRIRGVGDRIPARIDAAQQVAHRATRELTRTYCPYAGSGLRRVIVAINEGCHFPS